MSFIYLGGVKIPRELRVLGFVSLTGCLGSFFMEFPLYIFGIRPTGVSFMIFEVFFLFNQGTPYLYILHNKVLPWIETKLRKNGRFLINFN
ncbi:MAG: hypothetical protein ACTSUN_01835 [Promethearchaeota archaeon]